jgi:hypothetical protein
MALAPTLSPQTGRGGRDETAAGEGEIGAFGVRQR